MLSNKNRIPWNKGLTKETDERILKVSENNSKKLIEWHKTHEHPKGMLGKTAWNKGIPQSSEARKINSESHIGLQSGENHPMFGRKHKPESIEQMKKSHKGCISWNTGTKDICKPNSGSFKKGKIPWNKGKKLPEFSGVNACNWKGGLTVLSQLIRCSNKYYEWRMEVFIRDNYTCQECYDTTKKYFEAHHKDKFSDILKRNNITSIEQSYDCSELWDISNGITLCEECHNKTKDGGRINE